MFFGHIHHVETAFLPKPIAQAIAYIRRSDFSSLPAGRFIEPETGYVVQILDLQTQEKDSLRPEVHCQNIDVQYLVSGHECIGVVADDGNNVIDQALLLQQDIIFYQDVKNESMVQMMPGNFAVFFPEDVHRPACIDRESCTIRKVVIKIPVNLFK